MCLLEEKDRFSRNSIDLVSVDYISDSWSNCKGTMMIFMLPTNEEMDKRNGNFSISPFFDRYYVIVAVVSLLILF